MKAVRLRCDEKLSYSSASSAGGLGLEVAFNLWFWPKGKIGGVDHVDHVDHVVDVSMIEVA